MTTHTYTPPHPHTHNNEKIIKKQSEYINTPKTNQKKNVGVCVWCGVVGKDVGVWLCECVYGVCMCEGCRVGMC